MRPTAKEFWDRRAAVYDADAGVFYREAYEKTTACMRKYLKPTDTVLDFACGTGGFITSWLKELKKKVKTTEDEEKYANSIYGIEKKQFPYMLCITNMLLHDLDVPQVFHDNTLLRDVLDYTEDDQVDVILMNPPYGGSEKAEVKNHFPSDLASSETADLFMSVIMYRLKENGRAAVILPDGFLFGTQRLPSKQSCSRNLMCIRSFVCRAACSLRIHPSRPIFCSLTVPARQRKRGFTVWICRRATSISAKQSP